MLPPLPEPAELYAREEGKGSPVLLLHGLGGDHTVWNGVIAELSKEFHVLAPDLRGHGRSPLPGGSKFTFEELEQDLSKLLETRGLTRVHLVGLSGGGLLALRLALDRPALIQSLILVGAAAQVDGHTRAVGESWSETLRTEGYDAYIRRLAMDFFSPDWLEAHLDFADRMRESQRGRDLAPLLGWAESIRNYDVRARLGRLQVPTLVLHGMDDRVVDPSHARYLRQAIRGAQVRLFANTGHLVPIERPSETINAIREWANGHTTPGSTAP